ncbi:MAG: hypothetical protein ACM3YE_07745, partial [Bacteroidota bacterium]
MVTLSLVVINHSGSEMDFEEELVLPSDWQVIVPTASFTLAPNDQQVRLVTVFVPSNSPAGPYRIGYSIISRDPQRHTYQAAVNVEVAAISAIESFIEEKPQIVVAGEAYTAKLRYLNKGNSQIALSFEVKDAPDFPVEFTPAEMNLQPGESQLLTVTVQTDKGLVSAIRHILNIKAIDQKSLRACRIDTIVVDVIPSIVGEYGLYHRIPSQLTISGGWEKPGNTDPINPGFQLGFSGSGSIDEQGKNRVDLRFLTPNLVGSDFNHNSPYFEFDYAGDLLDLNAGSQNMALSPLTKHWSGYDNIKLDFHPQRHSLGIINPGQNEQGIYYGYQFTNWLEMRVNYLDCANLPDNEIYSWQGELKPFANTSLNWEYAFDGEKDPNSTAYWVNLRGYAYNKINYSLEKILAAPDFFGAYSDLESANGTISFWLWNKLQTSFSYHSYQNNLDLNPVKGTALNELTGLANLSYYLSPQTVVLASARDMQKKDRLLPAEYDNEERLVKLGFQHQFPRWRLLASIGQGESQDKLDANDVIHFKTYDLNVNYTPNSQQTYLFFVNAGDQNYNLLPEADHTIGVKANLQFWKNYDLNLEYQKRNFLADETLKQDYLTFHLGYTLNQLSIELEG